MITVVYSTHRSEEENKKFREHILNNIGVKDPQILEYANMNQYSLAQVYNKGISESIHNIVVCIHNDVKLSKNWGKKLLSDFEQNPEYGIIGKAGSTHFPESGIYWEKMGQTMVGQVYHHPKGKEKFISQYSPKLDYLIPVVTIDGLFIAFDKTKIKHTFDESIGKFHFYDHPFCLSNYFDGVKLGVTSSFEITHESVGMPNDEFFKSKDVFLEKYKSKLPLTISPLPPHINPIPKYNNKKKNKVAVIIPTKGKVELLFNCIDSFFEHCNPNYFTIFIADTGSSENEKDEIKNKYLNNPNIKLIEYDYYNFSKINNDVVKNHVDDSYSFLLFCNNDIKLLSNVIDSMLMTFDENPTAGTVGGRLYYEDNTIQHDGIFIIWDRSDGRLHLGHLGMRAHYNFANKKRAVAGNTGALLMIRRKLFDKVGMFNETYINCFEDVELNLRCILLGYKNYVDCNSVAYHLESVTRGEDPENIKKLNIDYSERLFPFMSDNIKKIQPFVSIK